MDSYTQDAAIPLNEVEYVLLSDDDNHWYVVAAEDESDFYGRIYTGDDFDGLDVTSVGGAPSLVKFKLYRIE
jgi:hypothetical protein